LTLNSGNERWALEESTSEGLQGAGELSLATWQLVMQANNANVLLSGTLLGLDKTSGTVNADNQAAGNLWIESSGVTSLLNTEHALDPGDDFVGRWVRWLVEVDNTGGNVGLEVSLKWCASVWNWCEMSSADEDCKATHVSHCTAETTSA
jgi:hypothetical protein